MAIQIGDVFQQAQSVALRMHGDDPDDARRMMMAWVNSHPEQATIRELLLEITREGRFGETTLEQTYITDSVERGAVAVVYAAMEYI